MRVYHPDGDDYVAVFDTVVPVAEDDTFPVPDRQAEAFLDTWCERNGYDREAVVAEAESGASDGSAEEPSETPEENDGDEDADDADTCQVVKGDGEVCGRDLPCQYHPEG